MRERGRAALASFPKATLVAFFACGAAATLRPFPHACAEQKYY